MYDEVKYFKTLLYQQSHGKFSLYLQYGHRNYPIKFYLNFNDRISFWRPLNVANFCPNLSSKSTIFASNYNTVHFASFIEYISLFFSA